MGRTPARQTEVRQTPVRGEAEASAPKKVRLRKNMAMKSQTDLPTDILRVVNETYEADLQWVTDSVLGQPTAAMRQQFEINAWEPVTADMFGGVLDGIYSRKGSGGEIHYEGLVLMWRPMELTLEARAEERAASYGALEAQARMLKTGQLPGHFAAGFDTQHPTALSRNVVSRSVKPPIDIPTD